MNRREFHCVTCGRKMITYKQGFYLKCSTCCNPNWRIHTRSRIHPESNAIVDMEHVNSPWEKVKDLYNGKD